MTYEWILRLVHSIECQQTDEKSYNRQRKYSSNTQITVSSESCSDENRKDEEERRQTFFFFLPNSDASHHLLTHMTFSAPKNTKEDIQQNVWAALFHATKTNELQSQNKQKYIYINAILW